MIIFYSEFTALYSDFFIGGVQAMNIFGWVTKKLNMHSKSLSHIYGGDFWQMVNGLTIYQNPPS